ncbi:MAG: RnfABCDGE type electron transport complex subunit C [Desulfonatronovibrionaceae bacterium]
MEVKDFKGGLKLKAPRQGAQRPLISLQPGQQVIVPMKQDLGPECRPLIKKKQQVQAGDMIGESPLEHGACIHAPVAGTVTEITRSFVHFSGKRMSAVVISSDGPVNQADIQDRATLLDTVLEAGMVDFDKDTVPLAVKLDEARLNHVDSLIVNAMDVEPFFSNRIRILAEDLENVLAGARIIRDYLNIDRVYIVLDREYLGLLSDHQLKLLQNAILVPLRYKYPQAIDYLLVKAVLGKEVLCTIPCRDIMHSQDIDGLVLSVDTLAALGRKTVSTERVLTVLDSSQRVNANVRVQIGTPVREIFAALNYEPPAEARIIAGGPMMGQTMADESMPVTKDLQGIYILNPEHMALREPRTCIKCGLCVDVCPARLLPFMISGFVEKADYEKAQRYQLSSCFECGCCSYVCPSAIPLLHWIQFGKFEIFKQRSRL